MDKVKQLLEIQLNESLKQIMISNPKKKNATSQGSLTIDKDTNTAVENVAKKATKIKIRPVMISDKLMFQESSFVGTQVFHKNFNKQELIDQIILLLTDSFKQLELSSTNCQATILVSKSQTVTLKQKKLESGNTNQEVSSVMQHNRQKQYILKEGIPVPFLIDLGVQTKDGKTVHSKYDKFRQINRFLEFIEDVLPALPKDRRVSIVDFGCGKSYLTFAMYYYLKELNHYDIDVIGLDLKADVIRHCNELKDKFGYSGLMFLEGDISTYNDKEEVDMVVTLHACDTATDYALAKAIAWNAKVILSVPCCQHELNKQLQSDMLAPVFKYGLLKERMAALITDGIRANVMEAYGYETNVMEFIDMSHTPKNILLRGVKAGKIRKKCTSIQEVEQLMEALHTDQKLVSLMKNK